MAVVRFNTSLDEHILEYLDSEAKRIGVSRGGMISFMIEQYKTNRDSIAVVGQIQEMMNVQKMLESSKNEKGDAKNG